VKAPQFRDDTYPLRISRSDAIARVNRGHDWPAVHAARHTNGQFWTACGWNLWMVNEHPADATQITCKNCRKTLRLDLTNEPTGGNISP